MPAMTVDDVLEYLVRRRKLAAGDADKADPSSESQDRYVAVACAIQQAINGIKVMRRRKEKKKGTVTQ